MSLYIRNEIRIQDKNDCYLELSLQQRATLKYAIEPILEYDNFVRFKIWEFVKKKFYGE